MRRAIGLMAWPESPAVTFAMRSRRVAASTGIATKVETREIPSRTASRPLRGVGRLRDAAHVRRKLDNKGASSNSLRSSHHLIKGARIAAELQAAVGSVRAGNVQLVGGNALAIVENLDSSFIILARIAEDVRKNYDVLNLPKPGQFLFEKRRRPNVLQTDGIEHPGGGFPQPWRRIGDTRFSREALDDEASEFVEVNHILELDR